ncbi:MAG: hypothetical protein ACT4P8_10095 [Betaproteobacteria bacterium]
MVFRIFAGIVAVVLFLAFVGPVAVKLKDLSLAVVILIGVGLMLVDLWHSLREKDE